MGRFCRHIWLVMGILGAAEAAAQAPETLGGDAYFDFAFRDEARMLQRGHVEGNLAQLKEAREAEESEPADTGSGLGLSMPAEMAAGKSYRVADLQLECDHEYCADPEHVEALLRATGLTLGHTTTAEDLAIAGERLRKTGYFSHIRREVRVEGERVYVTFGTVSHTTVRKIHIDDSGALYDSEIRKRMILRPGGAIYPRTVLLRGKNADAMDTSELIAMALKDQSESLRRIYVKEGYFDAEVEITTEEIAPHVADLHVRVKNARSYVLGKIYVRGHKVRTYSDLESSFRSEFSMFGNVTKAAIEDAVSGIVTAYRENGYYQAKIDFVSRRNPETHTIDVFLDIHEGKHWVVDFEGNEALADKELLEALTFKSSGYVDRGEVESSSEALVNTYITAGYYHAEVYGEILRNALDGSDMVLFHVEEGARSEIGEIVFDGASVLTREALLEVIDSQEYSAFGSGAYPQRAMIADDGAKIVDAYRARGYLNADVPGWTLESIEPGGRLRLTFVIREGEPSHFGTRQIRYTDREQYDRFDVLIDQPSDDVFSDLAFRTERAAITKQLRQRGHATISDRVHCTSYTSDGAVASEETCEIAEFQSACMPSDLASMCTIVETRNGPQERCLRHYDTEYGIAGEPECRLSGGITGTEVDVEYEVTLGPIFSFGDVFIHGNEVTRNWVVRQDIPFKSGEIYDVNRVIEARSLLRRRTIYKSASLNAIGVDDDLTQNSELGDSTTLGERSVPIVVTLEEGERRWIDFALGLSLTGGDWILTGEMEFVEANLLGTGWALRLLVMPEARVFANNSEFVFTQKFNQNFFTLLTLTIPVIPASGFNIVSQLFYDLRYIPDTNKEEYGWLVELQWNISKSWFSALAFELESSNTSSFGIDVSDDLTSYHACYPVTFFMDCPFSSRNEDMTVSLTPRVSYDGRDSPVVPKYGFYIEGKAKFAYSNTIGFYAMPEFRASYVYTFLKYFTAAFNLRFGMSFHESGESIPLIDRYFLGGLNMRGYPNEALGPRLVNSLTPNVATNEAGGGEVLFNLTAELRYPIWTNIGIYGAVFVDMGSLTEYQPTHYSGPEFGRELFDRQMRYTAGLGLRWHISESIPPIVIDYGFILNRRRGDPLGNFSLNIGYSF